MRAGANLLLESALDEYTQRLEDLVDMGFELSGTASEISDIASYKSVAVYYCRDGRCYQE
jgi:hypothetical protein